MTVIIPDSATDWITRHRYSRNPAKWNPEIYNDGLLQDLQQIEPFLPARVESILDIGCGMAGIDVFLKRRYPEAKLYLLDGDGDDQRDGWNPGGLGAFSSRDAAEHLLRANGVTADGWYNIGTKKALKADLVISLASWGYHYPLSAYNVSGFCIADIRKGTTAARGQIIHEWPKRYRCAWHQQGKA